jgi:hypothetical protein
MTNTVRTPLRERIAGRSWAELRTRARQEACKRLDAARYRLGLSFTSSSQAGQAQASTRFFFSPQDIDEVVAFLRERLPEQVRETVARAEGVCRHEFDLLGYAHLQHGPIIDWHLDIVHGKRAPLKPWFKIRYLDFDEVGDAKIIWELNRHQHLTTLARAYLFTGEQRFASEIFRQWYDWRHENPYPLGINWASSLEVGFRSLSWLWVRHLCEGCPAAPKPFFRDLLHTLGISGRHIERNLSTYFSPNTHLLGEGVALFFIGTLCPQLPAAKRWRRLGWEIVCREAQRQVRADGLYFEQSLYYHVYALDFFLHARLLAAANGIPVPGELDQTLRNMLEALAKLSQVGVPPRLGDDDGGRVFDPQRNRAHHLLDPLAIGALLYGRVGFLQIARLTEEAVWLFGSEAVSTLDQPPSVPPAQSSAAFESSGVYVMAAPGPVSQQAVIDAGPLGAGRAGHGHADALSLTLSVDGREWLVDPGTFAYVSGEDERDAFRGTAAHNTMRVDGADQAEPSGPFVWRSLPDVHIESWVTAKTFDLFVARHTGYARLPNPVIHRRCVFYLKSQFWLVIDLAEGKGTHRLELSWHLTPESVPRVCARQAVHFVAEGESALALLTPEDHDWIQELNYGSYSRVYGMKEPCPVLRFEKETQLPATFATLLHPARANDAPLGRLIEIKSKDQPAHVHGYHYQTASESHYVFLSGQPGRWSLGPCASDGSFVYCCAHTGGELQHFAFCGASIFEWNSRRLFDARCAAGYFEWERRESVRQSSSYEETSCEADDFAARIVSDRQDSEEGAA